MWIDRSLYVEFEGNHNPLYLLEGSHEDDTFEVVENPFHDSWQRDNIE